MKEHLLKTIPSLFQQTICGMKDFEYRKNDRDFLVGDILWLKEYDPAISGGSYTGRNARVVVQRIWNPLIIPGLPFGYVIMQIYLIKIWHT